MRATSLLLAGAALLAAANAQASGFQVNLNGQKNNGMGGTGTGLYLDQAAQFYNPGAFAFVKGNGVQLNANAAIPRLSFRAATSGGGQETLQNTNVFPVNGYAGFGVTDKFRVGIGFYTPFGSELHYQQGWTGRYTLTDINLRSVFAQATASYAITPELAVGAGLVMLAYGDVDLQKDVPLQSQNPSAGQFHAKLSGKADQTYGYNLGAMYRSGDKFSVGVSYRSAMDARISGGDITLTNALASAASSFDAKSFDVTLPLPDVYSIGFGVQPTDKVLLAFDANLVGWSRYKSLDFAYNGGKLGGNTTSSSKRQYQDALAFRLGGAYKVSQNFTLRAGGFYDFSAVRDGFVTPETPDADRIGITGGFTYAVGQHFGIDGSFLFEDFMQRSQSQDDLVNNGTTDRVAGTYKTTISVPGVGLYVKF